MGLTGNGEPTGLRCGAAIQYLLHRTVVGSSPARGTNKSQMHVKRNVSTRLLST